MPSVAVGGTHFKQEIDLFAAHAVRIVDISVRTGEGDDFAAEFVDFLCSAPCDVAETTQTEGLACEVFALMFEHFFKEVGCAETRCFGTNERTAVTEAFSGENAVFVSADDFLILTEQIADFATADAHIACGNVHIRPDMTIKFVHKGLAETHDFGIALAGGIEVRAALCAAHRKGGEGVFESLLETEELHCVEVDVLLESQTALVRPDSIVELNAETAVDVIISVVIHPRNAEHNLSVRFDEAFEDDVFAHQLLVLLDSRSQRRENFFDGLHKLRLIWVFQFSLLYDFTDV